MKKAKACRSMRCEISIGLKIYVSRALLPRFLPLTHFAPLSLRFTLAVFSSSTVLRAAYTTMNNNKTNSNSLLSFWTLDRASSTHSNSIYNLINIRFRRHSYKNHSHCPLAVAYCRRATDCVVHVFISICVYVCCSYRFKYGRYTSFYRLVHCPPTQINGESDAPPYCKTIYGKWWELIRLCFLPNGKKAPATTMIVISCI